MTDKDTILTIDELELLCKFYMECKLSVFEEMELEYVFLNTNINSPIIQDVKKIMGLEKLNSVSHPKLNKSRMISNNWLKRIGCIAASIIFISIIGTVYVSLNKNKDRNNFHAYCLIYSNGVLINDEKEALSIAEKNLRRMESFENKMELIQTQEKEKVDKFNKITIQ